MNRFDLTRLESVHRDSATHQVSLPWLQRVTIFRTLQRRVGTKVPVFGSNPVGRMQC